MQSLNVFEKGIGYLEACLEYYNGASAYLMLYVIALIYLMLRGTKREKEIFLPCSIFLLVTVYNPVAPVILDHFFDVNSEYYRFFWITPVIILLPYLAVRLILNTIRRNTLNGGQEKENTYAETEAVSKQEQKMESAPKQEHKTEAGMTAGMQTKTLTVFCLLLVILACSGTFLYQGGVTFADNIYKMPQDMIEVSELIHKDTEVEYPKAFLEYEYNMQMRQYDPKLLLTVDREDYLYAVANDFTEEQLSDEAHPQYKIIAALVKYQEIPVSEFLDALEETHTEYVVLDKGSPSLSYLKEAGLSKVGETATHTVMKYELREPYRFELVDYSEVY